MMRMAIILVAKTMSDTYGYANIRRNSVRAGTIGLLQILELVCFRKENNSADSNLALFLSLRPVVAITTRAFFLLFAAKSESLF